MIRGSIDRTLQGEEQLVRGMQPDDVYRLINVGDTRLSPDARGLYQFNIKVPVPAPAPRANWR